MRIDIASAEAMERFGADLAGLVQAGCLVLLSGELGSGKTTLARGFIRARGHDGAVKSPTFTLVEPYQLSSGDIYHVDLYRLNNPAEVDALAIREHFDGKAICLVEWPERGGDRLPVADLQIDFIIRGDVRQLALGAATAAGQDLIKRLPVTGDG